VVADEDRRGKGFVDPLHHLERPRKPAHDAHVVRKLVDEDALAVAVRVADDDLGRTGGADRGNGGVDLAGHPFARTLILEPVRPELRRVDDARDALHVDGDEDLPGTRLGGNDRWDEE
jgi:hypothetical protein